ncbi:hypothetical protein SAMN05444157_0899 [Frankineae bacterium MT45]|nr:hypothetical protein SAMN05444157_0899 [Frankineae bacterium MT45]
MKLARFASCAVNGEDVVVARAFEAVAAPTYLQVRDGDGGRSELCGLDAIGWKGQSVRVEAPELAAKTIAGLELGPEVQVVSLDSARLVGPTLEALHARGSLPWVVLVTVSAAERPPGAGKPELAGYTHTLFDGVSDYFLRLDHPELAAGLGYPACSRDDFTTPAQRELTVELDDATAAAGKWQAKALAGWNEHAAFNASSAAQELIAIRKTVSWRVTKPLRAVRVRAGIWRRK